MRSNAFFLGKGGVGKTTLSAGFALALAASGKRVLVASLDPAHNLGDVLGSPLGDRPVRVQDNLDALEVDLASWVEKYLEESRRELKATYAYTMSLNLDSFYNIMKYSPGTEEYAVLWAIEHIHCELAPGYDVVVYDTPPTALSLRFLAMPAISELWVAELVKLRARILEKRTTITRLNPTSPVASSCVDRDDDKVYGKLGAIRKRLQVLNMLFTRRSFISVVVNPDQLSVSEAKRIKEELDRIDIPLDAVCLNKSGMSTAPWTQDPALSAVPMFSFEFRKEGIHARSELPSRESEDLLTAFIRSEDRP